MERAYRDMYLESEGKGERARACAVARSLAALVQRVDRGAAMALDHLIDKWLQKGDITPAIIQASLRVAS